MLKAEKIYFYCNYELEKLAADFSVKLSRGLGETEVKKRLQRYGHNEIDSRVVHWYEVLGRQFKSPFIYLLFGAAGLTLALGERIDCLMILLFIAINTGLGFHQEYKSEKTLQLLKQYVTSYAKIIRDGRERAVLSSEIVPGDILVLQTGDKLSADVRFISADDLEIDESPLTGESIAIRKTAATLKPVVTEIYQAQNIGFSGTTVVSGHGLGLVLFTGEETALGDISHLTLETKHVSAFERGISRFSNFILKLVLVTLFLVFIANLLIKGGNNFLELILFSIALAVSVIPEALPLVTTFSLSRGALHLAKHKVVVKRLSAIEDLGSVDILCTDKTGTITENVLTVEEILSTSSADVLLYANLASAEMSGKKLEPFDVALGKKLKNTLKQELKKFKHLGEVPFDPERRRNAVAVAHGRTTELIIRGAAEMILELCNLSAKEKKSLTAWLTKKGLAGCRTLAMARRSITLVEAKNLSHQIKHLEQDLELVGLISFVDPIKETTWPAVKRAEELGVQIKILTGDSKEVAGAVAAQIGLISEAGQVITGAEFVALTPKKQQQAAEHYAVFARVAPEQKYAIIKVLEELGHEVGFLGEGINDAPALKISSVSLVVQGASDIAREAADVVLLQSSLKVIIDGIKEGRIIFANTTKYIKATLTSNFGNFYAVAVASLFINFLPMLPLQILLLNLLSDFPMIAIATDNVDIKEVAQPRQYQVKSILAVATVLGLISTIFDFLFFALFYKISPGVLQTNWFIGSILTELILLFSIRTTLPFWRAKRPGNLIFILTIAASILTVALPYTVFGQQVFSFVAPSAWHLTLIFGLVIIYFVCTEVAKLIYCRYSREQSAKAGSC